ncbi:MAG: DEAD/DEAH box helicase [Rikenellaceae bacterium]
MIELDEFQSLGLTEKTLKAIRAKGFEKPSAIQALTIPVLLANQNDIIAQAQTGTGKTAAFGLPILEQVVPNEGPVQALILVPTRELALQVTDEILSYKDNSTTISAIYGGASMQEQLRRLKKGVDIVVGTPGRILDHLKRGTLNLNHIKWLILDEADEMLDMGFIEDVEEILSNCNEKRRILLFSATMPQKVSDLSRKFMRDVQHIKVENTMLTSDLTDQIYFEVREGDKFDALTRIIDVENDFYAIIFCRTKLFVDELVIKLMDRGYAAEGLHGDVSQALREKILSKFKRKQVNILVATDVAARGIDVNNLTHVINYSLPQDSESYVHRIGRTGRAGNQGTAITFISNAEFRQFTAMKRQVKADIRKEEVPTIDDIITTKKKNILVDVKDTIESELFADYSEMAEEIATSYDPKTAIAALLKLAFKSDLDVSAYSEIRKFSVDRKGTARIFIAMVKKDGYTPRSIVDMVQQESGLAGSKINDVKILDEFSFISIPYEEAEHVTHALNKLSPGRPVAEIAKERGEDGSPRRGGFGGDRRGGERRSGGFGGDRRSSGGGFGGERRSSGGSYGGGDRRSSGGNYGGGDRRSSGGSSYGGRSGGGSSPRPSTNRGGRGR